MLTTGTIAENLKLSRRGQEMNTTKAGDLWRREGDHIMVIDEPTGNDLHLTMEDLQAMVLELERHTETTLFGPALVD